MRKEYLKEKDIINILYNAQEEVIDEILKQVDKEIKKKIESIDLEKIVEHAENPKELKEIFNKIENNYNIRISRYNREMYKQGFIDGIHLIINCLK